VEDSGSALMPAGACEAGVRTAPLRAVDIVGSPVEVSPAHEASAETQTVEGNDVVRQLSGGTSNFLLGSGSKVTLTLSVDDKLPSGCFHVEFHVAIIWARVVVFSRPMRRREFLTLCTTSVGGILVYSLDRQASRIPTESKRSVRIPLRFFSQAEALVVAAAASRIFPSDETGPGAREAGVVVYIDRQLAGPWGRDCHRYTQEPFEDEAPPEFGYQGKATPRQIYRQGLRDLKGFDVLDPVAQDEKLKQIEGTLFFSLLRRNTIEGMFCDPMHGGNVDMIGWQLIGFPGPRMSNYADVDKHFGEAFRPKPASLTQITGSNVRPSEDEE
jgi:gluconate 2-dehydrogenase gamma chain